MTGSAWAFSARAGRFVSVPEAAILNTFIYFFTRGGVRGGENHARLGLAEGWRISVWASLGRYLPAQGSHLAAQGSYLAAQGSSESSILGGKLQ